MPDLLANEVAPDLILGELMRSLRLSRWSWQASESTALSLTPLDNAARKLEFALRWERKRKTSYAWFFSMD